MGKPCVIPIFTACAGKKSSNPEKPGFSLHNLRSYADPLTGRDIRYVMLPLGRFSLCGIIYLNIYSRPGIFPGLCYALPLIPKSKQNRSIGGKFFGDLAKSCRGAKSLQQALQKQVHLRSHIIALPTRLW